MVVPGGVEGQLAQQFAGVGEDADMQVADQDQYAGAGVAAAESDVVQGLLCRRVITPELSMRSWRTR